MLENKKITQMIYLEHLHLFNNFKYKSLNSVIYSDIIIIIVIYSKLFF
jgi:hypothetical protein